MRSCALAPASRFLARALPWLAALAVLGACSSAPPPRAPEPEPPPPARIEPPPETIGEEEPEPRLAVPEDTEAPAGRACLMRQSCAANEQCRGAPGCRTDWACGPARTCLDETVAYCDCTQTTFYAPGGCANRPYLHVGPCQDAGQLVSNDSELGIPDYDEQITTQSRLCTSNASCGRNQICWGVAGCMTDWSCIRARGCSRHTVAFCGCDGATFMASSNCAGQPFVHRGACRGDEAIAVAEARRPVAPRVPTAATPAPPPPVVSMTTPEAHAPGTCTSNRDCSRGRVCSGPMGCGFEWTCQRPERECVRDTQVFCDCEGHDFRASMFCPGRPYRHRGSCEIDRMLELSGAGVR